jgi:hypothetical protein
MVVHLYYRSPELSRQAAIQDFGGSRAGQDEQPDKEKGRKQESYKRVDDKAAAQAKPEVKASMPKSAEVLKDLPQQVGGATSAPSSKEAGVPFAVLGHESSGDRAREKSPEGEGRYDEIHKMAQRGTVPQAEVTAKTRAEPSPPKPAEELSRSGVASLPPPQVQEFLADDVRSYDARVKALLDKAGGKLLNEEVLPGSGLLLTVEIPQSRQSEFLAALEEEDGSKSKPAARTEGVTAIGGIAKKEGQEKDSLTASERAARRKAAPALQSSFRSDEPMTKLQLRILPKK